jgi:ABC-type lipoprotein release transport system permease subunit
MRSVWMVFRAELRRRRSSWAALALLVAVIGGTVLFGVSAAQRTTSAYPNFVAKYGYDAGVISSNQFAKKVEHLPGVQRLAHAYYYANGNVIAGGHFIPTEDISVTSVPTHRAQSIKLISGHWATTTRQIVIGYSLEQRYGLPVGALVQVPFASVRELPAVMRGSVATYSGARITFRVVGVAATIADFPGTTPSYSLYASPAFVHGVGTTIATISLTLVRVDSRPNAMLHFQTAVNHLTTPGLLYSVDLDAFDQAVEGSIHPQTIGWWLFALFAAIAGLALVGQALSRERLNERDVYPTLSALGLRPGQLIALGMLAAGAIGVLGAVGAVVVAVVASPLAPVGEARAAGLVYGISASAPTLVLGALAILVVTLALGAWPSWRAAQVRAIGEQSEHDNARRSSTVASLAGSLGTPPSVLIGVRNALERGKGRTGTPVATALIGTVLAVAAIVATSMFGASFSHLIATPRLYGANWQVDLGNISESQVRSIAVKLRDTPGVTRITDGVTGKYVDVNGTTVQAILVQVVKGPMVFSLVQGHEPRGDGQIVLGSGSLRAAHAHVGSRIPVSIVDASGKQSTRQLTVVGIVTIPPSFNIGGLGDGAVMTLNAARFLACGAAKVPTTCDRRINETLSRTSWGMAVGTADTARGRAVAAGLNHRFAAILTQQSPPTSMINFGQAIDFPLLLGATFALFGAAALTHLLIVSVARRRRQFALLKVIGFLRRQVAMTLYWQAITVVTIGVIFGVPVGAIVGQLVWRTFISNLGAVPVTVLPFAEVGTLVAGIVVGAVALAVIPAALAGRVQPGTTLREAQ